MTTIPAERFLVTEESLASGDARAIVEGIVDAAAPEATSAPDVGEGLIGGLDTNVPTLTWAHLGDSISREGYPDTAGRAWPHTLAVHLGAKYTRTKVEYAAANSSPVGYPAFTTISSGASSATVLDTTFPGSAGALAGTSPETGGAWSGTGYNLDGNGNASQIANTATTAAFTTPGRVKTTVVYELVPTVSGTVNILGAWTSSSTIPAWVTDNSTDTFDCKVTVGGSTALVKTFTYAEAGVSASATADVTVEIDMTTPGQITFKVGAATYVHLTTTDQENAVLASPRAGMSGTRAGHKIRSITSTGVTTPLNNLRVYNGAMPSRDAQWSLGNIVNLLPVRPTVLTICHSHNHEAETPDQFEAALVALVDGARDLWGPVPVVLMGQNLETSATVNYVAHAARQAALRGIARRRGYGYVPAYERFLAQPAPASLVRSDGVHPTTAGTDLLTLSLETYYNALSLKPIV